MLDTSHECNLFEIVYQESSNAWLAWLLGNENTGAPTLLFTRQELKKEKWIEKKKSCNATHMKDQKHVKDYQPVTWLF